MVKRKKDETSIRRRSNPQSSSRPVRRTDESESSSAKPRGAKAAAKPARVIAAKKKTKTTTTPPAAKKAAPKPRKAQASPAVELKATTKAKVVAKPAVKLRAPRSPQPVDVASIPAPTARVADWGGPGEQERVGAVKYGAGPTGAFDEQRFLFPRNYELNRVRLVVRDPEWLFAYWDVNPRAFETIRREMGERAMALSRLTLQVGDPEGGSTQVILLPYGARSWYVRIDPNRPHYRAELGITLPSGQFRSLASSNVVAVPRLGPSPQAAARSIEYRRAWASTGDLPTGVEDATAAGQAVAWLDPGTSIRPPAEELAGGASDRLSAELGERLAHEARPEIRGGASDTFRR
jgi:hypothetical protein